MDDFTGALEATVQRGQEFHRHLTGNFSPGPIAFRLEWDPNVRPAIGYSFIRIGLQHLGGLLLLAEKESYVSCLALLRPMIEAHVRGLWFLSCATEKQVKELAKTREKFRFPAFREMLETVAKDTAKVSAQFLSGENWADLCDYTHGGLRLMERSVLVEANSDKSKVLMTEAIRNSTKAAGVTTLLFLDEVEGKEVSHLVRFILSEYLSDENSYRLMLDQLKRRLAEAEVQQHFQDEVGWYKQRGDSRRREQYKENPFDE
jgi:hypothetical protein